MKRLLMTLAVLCLLAWVAGCAEETVDQAESRSRPSQIYTMEQFTKTISVGGNSFNHDETRLLVSSNESGVFNVFELDLATGNRVDGTVSVLLGDGAGGFAPFTDGQGSTLRDYWVGGEPVALLTGDYNGDTLPDLVVAVRGDPSERGLRVLLGAPR